MKKVLSIVLLSVSFFSSATPVRGQKLSSNEMKFVLRIAKAINAVHPRLSEKKYMEYALGIYRASVRYQVEPVLLIAIANQETNFREKLPEGLAGERGICQIRKMWLNNPYFIKEFNVQTTTDLENPSKSFLFAAWILSNLKKDAKKGTIPYWSYYNSVKFENRLRYYLGVSRYLGQIKAKKTTLALGDFPQREAASCAVKTKSKKTFPSVLIPRLVENYPLKVKEPKTYKTSSYFLYEATLASIP